MFTIVVSFPLVTRGRNGLEALPGVGAWKVGVCPVVTHYVPKQLKTEQAGSSQQSGARPVWGTGAWVSCEICKQGAGFWALCLLASPGGHKGCSLGV